MAHRLHNINVELNRILNDLMTSSSRLSCVCDDADEDEDFYVELCDANDELGEAINRVVNVAQSIKSTIDASRLGEQQVLAAKRFAESG